MWVRVVILAALVVASGPTAHGELTLEVGEVATVKPEGAAVNMTVTARMPCQEAAAYGPPGLYREVPISIPPAQPGPGIMVSGPATILIQTDPCILDPGGLAEGSATYWVSSASNSPGLVPILVEIKGTSPPAVVGAAGEALTATGTTNITVGYYPGFTERVAEKVLTGSPGGTLDFVLVLQNKANAATTATFELANNTQDFDVVLPAPVVLPAGNGGAEGPLVNVTVTVMLPNGDGWNNAESQILLKVHSNATADSTLVGPTASVSLLPRVRGMGDVGSPTPTAPLFALALLAVALVARRSTA